MVANIEKFQNGENNNNTISLKEFCSHFSDITDLNISPVTSGCEECEKEGTPWIGLRLCLACGYVG